MSRILAQHNECTKCLTVLKTRFCQKCLEEFRFRKPPTELSTEDKVEELLEWKKAEIPQNLIRVRACELLGYSVRPSQLRNVKAVRGMIQAIRDAGAMENGKI